MKNNKEKLAAIKEKEIKRFEEWKKHGYDYVLNKTLQNMRYRS